MQSLPVHRTGKLLVPSLCMQALCFFLARPKFISQLFLTQVHVLPFFSFSIWGLYCSIDTGMLLCELQHSYEPLILSKGTTPSIEEQNTKLSGTLLIGRWIWLVPSQIKPNRNKKAVLLVNFFRLCTCFLIHYPLTLKETIMDSQSLDLGLPEPNCRI